MTIYNIPGIIKTAMPLAFTQANIQAGFSKTGMYPYNQNLFQETDFAPSFVRDRSNPDTEENNPVTPSVVIDRSIPDTRETYPAEPSFLMDRPNLDAGENNPRPKDEIPLVSASLLGESSIPNSSNVQPTTSSSATSSVFSPEIVRPFPKAGQRKTRCSRTKKKNLNEPKEKDKGKRKNKAKKRKTSPSSSDEEEYFCLVCSGAYAESRAVEKWIKCQGECQLWSHMECAGNSRHYICHNCDESD